MSFLNVSTCVEYWDGSKTYYHYILPYITIYIYTYLPLYTTYYHYITIINNPIFEGISIQTPALTLGYHPSFEESFFSSIWFSPWQWKSHSLPITWSINDRLSIFKWLEGESDYMNSWSICWFSKKLDKTNIRLL